MMASPAAGDVAEANVGPDLDDTVGPLVARYARETGLLRTIPGFGEVVTAGWLGAIGPAPHER